MIAPPTFTEADAQTLLDDADAATITRDPATGHYICALQIQPGCAGVGSGPERRVAVLAAVEAALGVRSPRGHPVVGGSLGGRWGHAR